MVCRGEGGFEMTKRLEVNEEVFSRVLQVQEWMASKWERDVSYDEVLNRVLDDFQLVSYPEELGSA
jgi:hypothetical protein